ncbi:amino acid/amide ABC transporter membrane protein 2 (HAAT family) [Breoghania corrubedonensis]|uniref:Amino acid/amide ABC transporter membrane protein 2 (HAAT family) n=1 Tax=Breoghania corrubedonensis TaxID=665038 RepID=A0A2T5VC83_9HYPH|nr:branched-chain amino acid ABC transporter permease [Breoghania corrubedonensis]PTW61361.1 amino acid/amide ABC transporter membrane protein 2 (HAAT family) [Breoghania corrubedonensis]
MTRNHKLIAQALAVLVAIVVVALAPGYLDLFTVMQLTLFASMAVLSLSLAFIWGFGGILSFGQSAFFGLGGYAYAVAVGNFGDSTPAIVLAILVPALFAGALGYFVFYGRISDVYLGVITLTVTLILFNVVNSTAGNEYTIGSVRLGGFNGIPAIQTFNMPFDPSDILYPEHAWWVTGGLLIVVYLGLRLLIGSTFGRIAIAVRENETRAALLGYDPRLVKLGVFVIGGAIAGLAGALYVNWGAFVGPTIFSLSLSAEIIIWITVGSLGTLVGPILGCVLIQYLVSQIGTQQTFNSNLVLGVILVGFVLLLPKGIVLSIQQAFEHLAYWWGQRKSTLPSSSLDVPAMEGEKG